MSDQERAEGGSRQSVALWVGSAIGLVVVVAVLLVTLAAGEDDDAGLSAPSSTTAPDGPAISIPQEWLQEPLPEGDYGPVCEEVMAQVEGVAPTSLDGQEFGELYLALDFAPLLDKAPPGLGPSILILRDARDDVVRVLDQVGDLTDVEEGDLPDGFLRALVQVGRAITTECMPGGTATTVPGTTVPGATVESTTTAATPTTAP